jgi:hypothetical protein
MITAICLFALNSHKAYAQELCSLVIEKVVLPPQPPGRETAFTFEIITENGTETSDFNSTVIEFEAPQSVTVTELLTPEWTLQSIECEQGSENCGDGAGLIPCLTITVNEETNSITAECLDTDSGSCIFTNVPAPKHVPTLSEWGLITMAGLLGIIGFIVIRKKQLIVKS